MSSQTNKTRLYEALGQILVTFNALEQSLEAIIFCSMDVSPAQVRILMSSMSFSSKVATMESLLRDRHASDGLGILSTTLQELIERCAYCESLRNEWICSYWMPEFEADVSSVRRLVVPLNESELTLETIHLAELESFIDCLRTSVNCLHAFHLNLFVSFGRVLGPEHFHRYLETRLDAQNDPR